MPKIVTHFRALVSEEGDATSDTVDWVSVAEQGVETRRFVENVLTLLVKVANTSCDLLRRPLALWEAVQLLLEPPPLVDLPLGMRHTAFMAITVRISPTYNDDYQWWIATLMATPRLVRNFAWWALERDDLVGSHAIITSQAIKEIEGCIRRWAIPFDVAKLTTATRAVEQARKDAF
jgi:hypothetical protein